MQKNAKIRYVFERRMQTSCGLGATSQLTSSPSHSRLLCRKCMQVHSAFNNAARASIGRPNWPSRPPNSSFQASLLLLPVSCTTNILLAISVTRFVTMVEGVEPSCKLCVAHKMFFSSSSYFRGMFRMSAFQEQCKVCLGSCGFFTSSHFKTSQQCLRSMLDQIQLLNNFRAFASIGAASAPEAPLVSLRKEIETSYQQRTTPPACRDVLPSCREKLLHLNESGITYPSASGCSWLRICESLQIPQCSY